MIMTPLSRYKNNVMFAAVVANFFLSATVPIPRRRAFCPLPLRYAKWTEITQRFFLFHILSCIYKNESATALEFLFEVDDEENQADFIIGVMGNSIQSELRTLENLFSRVRLNLERA